MRSKKRKSDLFQDSDSEEVCQPKKRCRKAANSACIDGEFAALSYSPDLDLDKLADIGSMCFVCSFCGALKWHKEKPGMCCSSGKVHIPFIDEPPPPLKSLMLGQTSDSKHFLQNLRKYNNCFKMTSFAANQIQFSDGFASTFKIQGQIYHRAGSVLPVQGTTTKISSSVLYGRQ